MLGLFLWNDEQLSHTYKYIFGFQSSYLTRLIRFSNLFLIQQTIIFLIVLGYVLISRRSKHMHDRQLLSKTMLELNSVIEQNRQLKEDLSKEQEEKAILVRQRVDSLGQQSITSENSKELERSRSMSLPERVDDEN